MIKIISFKICPFVQRVTAALLARNIEFEVEYINLKDKPQWFLDVSPNGQVPLLITEEGQSLFESDAIVEYIEDSFGPVEHNVTHEQRAINRAWSYQATKHYLVQCSTMRSETQETFTERVAKLSQLFEKAEQHLTGENHYFNSNTLSNVDIAWLPLLHRASIIEEHSGYDFLSSFPKVKQWQQQLMKLDLVNKSVSPDFEQRFVEFYLTNTYLGENVHTNEGESCNTSACCG